MNSFLLTDLFHLLTHVIILINETSYHAEKALVWLILGLHFQPWATSNYFLRYQIDEIALIVDFTFGIYI